MWTLFLAVSLGACGDNSTTGPLLEWLNLDATFTVTAAERAALVIASEDLVERILPGMDEDLVAAEIGPSLALLPGIIESGAAFEVLALTRTLATALTSLEAQFRESPDNVHLSVIRLVLDDLDARLEIDP